jgi:hypothetical protein
MWKVTGARIAAEVYRYRAMPPVIATPTATHVPDHRDDCAVEGRVGKLAACRDFDLVSDEPERSPGGTC